MMPRLLMISSFLLWLLAPRSFANASPGFSAEAALTAQAGGAFAKARYEDDDADRSRGIGSLTTIDLLLGKRLGQGHVSIDAWFRLGLVHAPNPFTGEGDLSAAWTLGPRVTAMSSPTRGFYAYGSAGVGQGPGQGPMRFGWNMLSGVGYRFPLRSHVRLALEASGMWFRSSEEADFGTYVYSNVLICGGLVLAFHN